MTNEEFLNTEMPIGNEIMEQLKKAASNYIEYSYSIEKLEGELEFKKELLRQLAEKTIPDYMRQAGVTKITLDNGKVIDLKKIYPVKIIEDEKAISWLQENGYGDLLKIALKFNKGDYDKRVHDNIAAMGLSFEERLDKKGLIKSLKKQMRLRDEAGEAMPPEDAIAVTMLTKASVK